MDRDTRKSLEAQAHNWEMHNVTRRRRAEQIASKPTPEYPATGTARISALLAAARARPRPAQ